MSIPYIKIYPSDMRALTSRLDKEQKLFIYEAIEDYGIFGNWPDLCNCISNVDAIAMQDFEAAYNLIKNKIEAETKNYKEKSEKLAQNAKKRWSSDESKSNPIAVQKQSNCSAIAMLTKNQEPRTNKEKINKKESKSFSKPSVLEIEEYCRERNNGLSGQHFFDFYEAKGWRIGKEPMKEWRAAVRTWEQRQTTLKASALPSPDGKYKV